MKEAYSEGITEEERLAKMKEADKAAEGMWCDNNQATYLPMGKMRLTFPELSKSSVTDYKRRLNMDSATSEVSFVKDGVTYTRESFTSYPDNVMATKISNNNGAPMDMSVTMELPSQMVGKSANNKVVVDGANYEVVMTGRALVVKYGDNCTWYENRGVTFEARVKVIARGGTVTADATQLTVKDAEEVILIYSCETSYKDAFTDPSNSGIDVTGNVRAAIDNAVEKGYDNLLADHKADFQSLFRRLWIDLDGEPIQAVSGVEITPFDYARHYQYCRYIMILAERENTNAIPHNLFGIWNTVWSPANQGAYFLNENLQKMHAIVGPGNITDTAEPLWEWLKALSNESKGGKTAKESFGIENAWTVSHSTDVWCKTEQYGESTRWSNWNSGGLWMMNDLYNAYEFTQDIDFLEEYYPVIEGAARFALGTLMQVDGVNGELKDYLVIAPSGSPEHWFTKDGEYVGAPDISTAADVQIYQNLFTIVQRAAKNLTDAGIEVDQELVEEVKQASEKMIPLDMYINEDGYLKEWYNEYTWGEAGHRHASHLLGLFLSYTGLSRNQPTAAFFAEQKELVRISDLGGGYHPDNATMAVHADMAEYGLSLAHHGIIATGHSENVAMEWMPLGSYIAQTILDSRNDELDVMAYVPKQWESGKIVGIRARGGYQLSIKWENGELVKCVIDSPTGTTPFVCYKGEPVNLSAHDSRFVLNRAQTTVENLIREATEKLKWDYSEGSKENLRQAISTNDYETISQALLELEPTTALVTVTAEDNKTDLFRENETVQLSTDAAEDTPIMWQVTDLDGNPTSAAIIDENGLLTAKEKGKVLATATLLDGSGARDSITLNLHIVGAKKEIIDDRDGRIVYSSNWALWDESKHMNGTIHYVLQPGETCTLAFEGNGIDFVSSLAGHTGAVKIEIDGQVVAENLHLNRPNQGIYAETVFEKHDLTPGEHTIKITTLDSRQVEIDGFIVYQLDLSALQEMVDEAKAIDLSKYTQESAEEVADALSQAEMILHSANPSREEAEEKMILLQEAIEGLVLRPEAYKASLGALIAKTKRMDLSSYTETSAQAVEQSLAQAEQVYQDPEASTEDISNAIASLQSAVDGLVNLSTLEYVLGIANGHVAAGDVDKLIPTAKEVFNKALASAQGVYDDPDATQEQVDTAWKMLMNVIQALGFVPGDKTELIDLVAQAKALDLNAYEDGAEKEAFTAALKAAEDLISDPDAMELDIEAAYNALSDAMQDLIPKPAAGDKTELKKVIDEANGKNSELDRYVDDAEAKQKFADALAAAKEIYEKDGATQEEIDQAKFDLIDAMAGLRLRADKSNLEQWLEDLKSIDLCQYTEESAAVVRAVIAKAEALAAQELDEDEQDLINVMVAEMAIAKAQLVPSADVEDPENPNPDDGSGSGESSNPDSGKPDGDSSSEDGTNSEGKEATDEVPTTGDSAPVAAISVMALAAVSTYLMIKRRR